VIIVIKTDEITRIVTEKEIIVTYLAPVAQKREKPYDYPSIWSVYSEIRSKCQNKRSKVINLSKKGLKVINLSKRGLKVRNLSKIHQLIVYLGKTPVLQEIVTKSSIYLYI